MIDAVDLRFIEYAQSLRVQFSRRRSVVTEGFLDDDARPRVFALRLRESRASKLVDDLRIDVWGRGEIEKPIAPKLAFAVQFIESLREA
jgi:hypothetical protein